ncbi:hypothetical protein EN855_010945 [Mesorhizobium sp. M1C.F.Ca.ET.212.01.1.1]|nr:MULTISPECIES: VOC family protein [unclassified Mesorhizobium]TGQ72527.1 hypothetical protein EN855_010945 [Mesorhizobium sp. M1C.F.Ca.ET.212.01.1.1]
MVQRLGYVALNVTDIEAAIDDACTIAGARVVERERGRALLTSNQRHAELVLHAGDGDSVRAIGLQAHDGEAVAAVRIRAEQAGLKILSERPRLRASSAPSRSRPARAMSLRSTRQCR